MVFCEQLPFARVSTPGYSNAIADTYIQDAGESFEPIRFPENAPSGIVVNEYGKDRVVYIVPPLDHITFEREFRLIRKMLTNAINWVTGNKRPFEMDAPTCVTTTMTEKGDQRIPHVNCVSDRRENLMSKAEWVAPINRIPISIRKPKGKKLSNVSLLGSGIEIRFRHRDEQDILYLPKLDVHEAIRLVYKSLGLSETVLKY